MMLNNHIIDRENATKTVNNRIKILNKNKKTLLETKDITNKELKKYLPSVSWIKVIKYNDKYVAFEGNGRLVAMKKVFSKKDNVKLQVQEFVFDNKKQNKMNKLISKTRKLNNLEK